MKNNNLNEKEVSEGNYIESNNTGYVAVCLIIILILCLISKQITTNP